MRLVSTQPEERMLIRNEIHLNAQKFLYRIRRVPEACAIWQWLFPERMPDFTDKWNQDGLLFPRQGEYPEVSIEAIGVGGASTSRHYTRIKEDDPIGKEAQRSPATMQMAKDDHNLSMHLLVDPNTSRIETYGTRWAPHDLYQDMMEKETGLDIFHCGPTAPDGSALFPARFPLPRSTPSDARSAIGTIVSRSSIRRLRKAFSSCRRRISILIPKEPMRSADGFSCSIRRTARREKCFCMICLFTKCWTRTSLRILKVVTLCQHRGGTGEATQHEMDHFQIIIL